MKLQTVKVMFDDGNTVEIVLKSRDVAKAERAGLVMDEKAPVTGSYALAFIALQRMQRTGLIDFTLPASAEALEDVADLVVEDDEGLGEDSTKAPSIG